MRLEEDGSGLGGHREWIGSLLQSGAKSPRQCRVVFDGVREDRLQLLPGARVGKDKWRCVTSSANQSDRRARPMSRQFTGHLKLGGS